MGIKPAVLMQDGISRSAKLAQTDSGLQRGDASIRPAVGDSEVSRLTSVTNIVILMTMSETRSLADVKAHLSELVAQVGAQHERVTVTVHGRPTAVLVAVDDLESLEETIAVLSDSNVVRALTDADTELAAGEGESEETLRAAMRARQR